jgi:hypothetical protein
MSDFMFGGSALTLDIGARNATGAAVSKGDLLQLDLTAATEDGYDAVVCQSGDADVGNYSFTGAVIAPEGLSIADGDSVILRVVGKCQVVAATSATFTAGQVCIPTDNAKTLASSAAVSLGSLAAADLKPKAIALETVGGGGATAGQLIDVFMRGFPL